MLNFNTFFLVFRVPDCVFLRLLGGEVIKSSLALLGNAVL